MIYGDSRDITSNEIITTTPDLRAVCDARFFSADAREGEYIIYRRFDKTQYSEYWDPEKEEAIGGPKYLYTDRILKVRRSWAAKSAGVEETKPIGFAQFRQPILYCRYDVDPQYEDIFFIPRFPLTDGETHTIVASDYHIQFGIIQVIPYQRTDGRIEYFACILKEELKK